MDFEKMNTEDLQLLKGKIEFELRSRNPNMDVGMVEYTHTCHQEPAYHFLIAEHWTKIVQIIDRSKDGQEAIIGRYLSKENSYMVPVNSIIVEVCDDSISAFKLTNAGKICILKGKMHQLYDFIEELERLFYGN